MGHYPLGRLSVIFGPGAEEMARRDRTKAKVKAGESPTLDSLAERISEQRLSPTHRRIAHFLLFHPGDAVFLSGSDLADRVGVSAPSVSRFAFSLGFDGYPDLLAFLRAAVAAADTNDGAETNSYQQVVDAEIQNLRRLQHSLRHPQHLKEIARCLMAASPLISFGLRGAASVATYFGWTVGYLHPNVRTMTCSSSGIFDALSQLEDPGKAWLVCFVFARYARDAIEALQYAQRRGIHIVLVSDRWSSSLPIAPDYRLAVDPSGVALFASFVGPMTLANVLIEAMGDVNPTLTAKRLDTYDHLAVEQNLFLSEGRELS